MEYSFDHCIVSIDAYRCRRSRAIANAIHSNGRRTYTVHNAQDIPHNTDSDHYIYSVYIWMRISLCWKCQKLLVCSVFDFRPSTHDSDPNKWCDGTWANRLWIRRATLSARRPYAWKRACAPCLFHCFRIFIYLYFVRTFVQSFFFLFWGKFFSRCCFSFSVFRESHIQSPHVARTHIHTSA